MRAIARCARTPNARRRLPSARDALLAAALRTGIAHSAADRNRHHDKHAEPFKCIALSLSYGHQLGAHAPNFCTTPVCLDIHRIKVKVMREGNARKARSHDESTSC